MTELIQYKNWQVRLIRSARKTLSLEIDSEGLKARAPMRMRENTVIEFIRHKETWIGRHINKVKPRPKKLPIKDSVLLPFMNQFYALKIQPNRRASVHIKNQQILLPLIKSQLDKPSAARAKLIAWYKQRALDLLQEKVAQHIVNIGTLKYGSVRVREYTRRWGSCSHQGDLSFNWRIILAPEAVIDYVVIHELAHLIEFNHSRKFWRIVEQQLPNWKLQKNWLSEHGPQLYII